MDIFGSLVGNEQNVLGEEQNSKHLFSYGSSHD